MKYKSEIFESVHEGAVAMYEVGGISEEDMREFDEMCLVPDEKPACKADKGADPSVRAMENISA